MLCKHISIKCYLQQVSQKPAECNKRLKSNTLHKLKTWYTYNWQAQQFHKQNKILNTEELFPANESTSYHYRNIKENQNSILQPMDLNTIVNVKFRWMITHNDTLL